MAGKLSQVLDLMKATGERITIKMRECAQGMVELFNLHIVSYDLNQNNVLLSSVDNEVLVLVNHVNSVRLTQSGSNMHVNSANVYILDDGKMMKQMNKQSHDKLCAACPLLKQANLTSEQGQDVHGDRLRNDAQEDAYQRKLAECISFIAACDDPVLFDNALREISDRHMMEERGAGQVAPITMKAEGKSEFIKTIGAVHTNRAKALYVSGNGSMWLRVTDTGLYVHQDEADVWDRSLEENSPCLGVTSTIPFIDSVYGKGVFTPLV